MTDRDVDVVLPVAGRGDGEQRGDRPALDDMEAVIHQAPFDVLGAAEVRLDAPAQLHEPHDLRIRQRGLLLPLRLDRLLLRPACRRGLNGKLLGGDRPGDDLAVPHLVDVRVHQAGDQGLAEAEAGLHGGDLSVGRDGIGGEQDAGRLREDHLLHDDGHADLPVVDAVAQAVGHGPLGEERGPAPADVPEDRRRPHDVQVRVLLAREGGRRQVLRRRAGSDGVGGLFAEPGERAGDRRRQIVGDRDPFERPADLRAERADRLPVVRLQARQPIEPIVDRRRFRHDPQEGVRRHAKAGRHADAFDPRKLPQVRALAASERDLRLVDLIETQHVAPPGHRDTSRAARLRCTAVAGRACGMTDSVEPRVWRVLISFLLCRVGQSGRRRSMKTRSSSLLQGPHPALCLQWRGWSIRPRVPPPSVGFATRTHPARR